MPNLTDGSFHRLTAPLAPPENHLSECGKFSNSSALDFFILALFLNFFFQYRGACFFLPIYLFFLCYPLDKGVYLEYYEVDS